MKSARDHTCNSVTIVKIIIMMYWSNTTYIAVRRSRVGLLSQLLSATPQVLDSSCELKRAVICLACGDVLKVKACRLLDSDSSKHLQSSKIPDKQV